MLPYALIGVILLGELQVFVRRRRPESRSDDRGSFWVVIALTAAGYWGAFFFAGWAAHVPSLRSEHPNIFLGPWAAWAGAVLTVSGTLFRGWAVRTLGQYFTPVVRVSEDQRVIDTGPYRWIRHPAYTGALAAAAGVGLALGNWPSLLAVTMGIASGFVYRIRVEESALVAALGEPYRAYRARTDRLIPFVW